MQCIHMPLIYINSTTKVEVKISRILDTPLILSSLIWFLETNIFIANEFDIYQMIYV